jgi:hypothetical protein
MRFVFRQCYHILNMPSFFSNTPAILSQLPSAPVEPSLSQRSISLPPDAGHPVIKVESKKVDDAFDECAVQTIALKGGRGLEGGRGEGHAVGQPETALTTREQEADFCMQERLSKIETRLEHLETKLSQVC